MKILTLSHLLQKEDAAPQVVQAEVVRVADEYGRSLETMRQPILGPMFQPRTRDRLSSVQPPWTPEQIIDALRAAEHGDMSKQSELFEFMEDRDGALFGFMQTRRLAPSGLKWSIEPGNDSDRAQKIAEFVRNEIRSIQNFPIAFRNATDAVGKSLSALWIDWREGGRSPESKYRVQALHHITPKRYRFHWQKEQFLILPDDITPAIGKTFDELASAGIGVVPPPWKTLIHQTRIRTGHPAKVGVLRICALYFLLRNYAFKDAATYCDVYGMPLRIGKYPDNASDEDKAVLADAIQNLGTDAAAIVNKLVEIEFLKDPSGSAGAMPFFDLIKECERQMELAILGQEQTNTSNKFGSRAQTEAGGAKVRQDLLEADCVDLESTFTYQLVYPIVMFSKFGQAAADDLCPKFKLHYEPEADYEKFIKVDVPLHTQLKLPTTLGQLAKRYNRELPEGVEPEELVTFTAEAEPDDETEEGDEKKPASKRARRKFESELAEIFGRVANGTRAQSEIDDLGDRGTDAVVDAIAEMALPIRAIVNEAESFADLEDRLRKAFDDLSPDDLARVIRRSLFVARLHGRKTAVRKAG